MAERDQFAEDYRTCPPGSRLAALSGVHVRVGAMEQLIVEWDQPDSNVWDLQGDTAVITVVTDAPRQLKQNTALDTTRAVFNDMDYFNHVWMFKVAITEGETVISEVVSRSFPYWDNRPRSRSSDRDSEDEAAAANHESTTRDTTTVPRRPEPDRSVRFGAPTYSVMEGESVPVTVQLGSDPGRTVTIPLTIQEQGGASPDDYTVEPTPVTFNRGERRKTVMVEAMGDNEPDRGESLLLSFDTLPDNLSARAPETATVKIMDQEVASFGASAYSVTEGASVQVTVQLSADPGRTVTIPLTTTNQGGASANDYSGVPASITFNSGETSQTFTIQATGSDGSDSGESVILGFGTLPTGIAAGTPDTATVTITEQQAASSQAASYGASTYTVTEGSSVAVTVQLDSDPGRTVTIPLTTTHQSGASASDYSGVPASITFNSGETGKTFTVQATGSDGADSGESVLLGFGTLPTNITAGTPSTTTVSITDQEVVSFGTSTYSVTEGASVTITVQLGSDPGRTVTIPLTTTNQGGASASDYSGVPASVTFNSGETSQTFTVQATGSDGADSGESVLLGFGTLPTGIAAGTPDTATVSITDQEVASFGASTYSVTEGASVTITVQLGSDPGRTVTIPLTTTNQGGASASDYSGVPASVTFNSGETSQTFTIQATGSDGADSGESVLLGFGTLPAGIAAGIPNTATVTITDQDVASFGASTYSVMEGASVQVTVQLSADPGRTVTIPLTKTNQGGASASDYSGVPASVTFNSGETSKTFTVQAAASDGADSGESVLLGFGTLPTGIAAGTPNTATVTITEPPSAPSQAASFGASTYTVVEDGAPVTVEVRLGSDPGRTVTIPLTTTHQGGATASDYSGVPTSITFNSGETGKTFTVQATGSDGVDNGESVILGFGTLPTGIPAGTPSTATVSISDRTFTESTGDIVARIIYFPETTPPRIVRTFRLIPPVVTLASETYTWYILAEANAKVIFEARWTPTDPDESNKPVYTFNAWTSQVTTMPACANTKPDANSGDQLSYYTDFPTIMKTAPTGSAGGTWDIYVVVTWGTVDAGHCDSSPDVPNIDITFARIEKFVYRFTLGD